MKLNKIFTSLLVLGILFSWIGINTFAENTPTYLDLEESQTYANSQDVEQNYTFTQHGDTVYTNVSKVKITWKINEITSTYTSHKTWDPANLQWVEAKEDISVTYNGAEFTLTNYSSYDVTANVKFTVETSLKDTFDKDTYTNNDCTVATPVNHNTLTYQESDFTAKAQTITASLTFKNDNFKDLSATASATKYGTYTVSINEIVPAVTANYLTFTANTAGSSVTPKFLSGTYYYSIDNGTNWTQGDNEGTEIILANAGDKVLLKGTNCVTGQKMSAGFIPIPVTVNFSMTGSISASGDVTSLTNGVGGDAELTEHCYEYMFNECVSLTTAPTLPSTIMADSCYKYMFAFCTSLTTVPALPSTTLATSCYQYMFQNCTSITTAPTLPATTLTAHCYDGMFIECISLTTAPVLSATNLASYCYCLMFGGCTGLTVAPTLPATTLADYCYQYMFQNCTGLTVSPTLPATVLDTGCYEFMFAGCTNLTAVPTLPTTTLVSWCYSSMFYGCSSLKIATTGSESNKIFTCTTDNSNNEVYQMFNVNSVSGDYSVGTPEYGKTYYWYTE